MVTRKFVGPRVSLAQVEVVHAEQVAAWLNDLEVAIPLGSEAYEPVTAASVRDGSVGAPHTFMIYANDRELPIGRCLLFNVNLVDRNASLGIFIGDKRYWNRGYGADAVRLLLEYAFGLLNLNSVMLGVFAFNTRAIGCYRSVGFKEIGRRRQARLIAGEYHDALLMDILAEEFDGTLVRGYVDAFGRDLARSTTGTEDGKA